MHSLASRTSELGRSCRHHSPLRFIQERDDDCAGCAKGHPIRRIVTGLSGSETGILFKLPCRPGPERVTECPDYDPKTDAEIEAGRVALREKMDRAAKLIGAAGAWRRKMIETRSVSGREDCPVCDGKGTVSVSIALGYNNHMACYCSGCQVGFRE
jgi:hypothetical protein